LGFACRRFDLLDDRVMRIGLIGFGQKVIAVAQRYSSDGIRLWKLHEYGKMGLGRDRVRIDQRCDVSIGRAGCLLSLLLLHDCGRFGLCETRKTSNTNEEEEQSEARCICHGCKTSSL